jgi:hypothetical protein
MFETFDEAEVQQTLRDFASMSSDDDITSYCSNPDVDELWAGSAFFGSGVGESNYFEYDCGTWECGLAMITQPVCDLEAVAEATTQLGQKKRVAKRASAVRANTCDLSVCTNSPTLTPLGADLPTLNSDYVPATCVVGILESQMEEFSDLLQQTIRPVFGSLTQTQMQRPAWASNPGASCWDSGDFLCADLYCSSALDSRLQDLRDAFTSMDMGLLRHSASSTCTDTEVTTAGWNIGGKQSFLNHFERVHACWSSPDSSWNTSGATRRLLAMAHA